MVLALAYNGHLSRVSLTTCSLIFEPTTHLPYDDQGVVHDIMIRDGGTASHHDDHYSSIVVPLTDQQILLFLSYLLTLAWAPES